MFKRNILHSFPNVKKVLELIETIDYLKIEDAVVQNNKLIITGSITDYSFPLLKEVFKQLDANLSKVNVSDIYLQIALGFGNNKDHIFTLLDSTQPSIKVDLLETLKSRLPSANNISLNENEILLNIQDIDFLPQTALNVLSVVLEHFNEEIDKIKLKIKTNQGIECDYAFSWLTKDVIESTVINSNRFNELMHFLIENPHPQVDTFLLGFKDSNRGTVAELNIKYITNIAKEESLNTTDFIRFKIQERFTHLPIF